ncbi:hypothetical protein BVX98_05645 [bacterium F11]|nr:hypothetical protein BVX98_05645 [bacterium F11]
MKPLSIKKPFLSLLSFVSLMLATCFFLSYLPAKATEVIQKAMGWSKLTKKKWTGAGLIGSLFGAGTFFLLPPSLRASLWLMIGGIVLSVIVSHHAEKILQSHDDTRIVIDEWIGVWVAFWGLVVFHPSAFLVAFVLFRFFDVWKGPWGNALQKWPGGLGVTADDVAAGILANVGARAIFLLLF